MAQQLITERIEIDDYFMMIAAVVGRRSTCGRRRVGCVLVDVHNHIIATGYNGVPMGFDHCLSHPCEGACLPTGTGLDKCLAIHAEQNALLQCSDIFAIDRCYTTTSPCIHCVKPLLNTSCKRIIFGEEYPHSESKELWERGGRIWHHHSTIIQ